MSDEKPSPLQDVRKGLTLLFRAARGAAKTAAHNWPAGGVEEVVRTSAKEVGRALENVASAIEREVLGKKAPKDDASPPGSAHETDEHDPTAPKPKP